MSETAAWIGGRIPRDRDLDLPELVEIATAIGEHRDLWQSLVRHDPGQRIYAELYRDLHFDLEFRNAPRMISANGDRTPAVEVIATRNIR